MILEPLMRSNFKVFQLWMWYGYSFAVDQPNHYTLPKVFLMMQTLFFANFSASLFLDRVFLSFPWYTE